MLKIPPNIQVHAKNTNHSKKTGLQIVITQNNFKSPEPTRPLKIRWIAINRHVARHTLIKKVKPRSFIFNRTEKIAKRSKLLLLIIRRVISLFEIMRAKVR